MTYRPNSQKPTNLPYLKHSSDSDAVADIGGPTVEFTAGASLLLGDTVFLSAANTVNKSIVAGDIVKTVGVVVGGANFDNKVITESNKYGVLVAADAGERVIVQTKGVVYVITEAAYAVGTSLNGSGTTAGRMITIATRALAILLEASSGVGAVAKALLL